MNECDIRQKVFIQLKFKFLALLWMEVTFSTFFLLKKKNENETETETENEAVDTFQIRPEW